MVKTDHKIRIEKRIILDRDGFILDITYGSKTVHLGCTDSGFTEEKFNLGTLLHQKLIRACNTVWGVDIDSEGIDFLHSKGIGNLICSDISTEELDINEPIDYIVAGEVIEHLSNPGNFVDALYRLSNRLSAKVIISVPNSFALFRFKKLFQGIEYVHEDHVAYYSPITISNLLARSNLKTLKLYGHIKVNSSSKFKSSLKKKAFQFLRNRLSVFADGLILIAEPN